MGYLRCGAVTHDASEPSHSSQARLTRGMPPALMPLRARRRLALALLIITAASCAPPLQNGGVELHEGFAERLSAICRFRHEATGGALPCAAPEERSPPARTRRITGPSDALGGPLAIGRAGDLLLENNLVVVVIDQLGRGQGFAESGGNLVDAADAVTREDELGQVFTYLGAFPRQAVYASLTSGVDARGAAWVEARGHELYEERLQVVTRYELAPGERALAITTTLTNDGAVSVAGLGLGDAVQWGAAEKFAPGQPANFKGEATVPWIGGAGRFAGYGFVGEGVAAATSATGTAAASEAALSPSMSVKSGTAWSNYELSRGISLAPGQHVSYRRALVIAPRGDTLGVAAEIAFRQGRGIGAVEIEFVGPRGEPLAPPEGGQVVLEPQSGAGASVPLSLRISAAASAANVTSAASVTSAANVTSVANARSAAADAPTGQYLLSFEDAGRRELGKVAITVEPGKVAKARLAVSDASTIRVALRERDRTGDPAPGSERMSPAKVQLFDAATSARVGLPLLAFRGVLTIPAAPGRYRVVASRGPEFALAEKEVTVPEGSAGGATVELTLDRVVRTRGFVACDLHQHTARSFDAGVSTAERAASNAAEGVECAVASEHNAVVDMAKVVERLGLAAYLRSIVGDELTSDASRDPFGHVNAFPLTVDPADARGGALSVRDKSAKEVFDALRALPGERVIQVNHPRLGRIGYFDQLRFDPKTGVGAAPGYDARFDAVEVWSGRHAASRDQVLFDLWALLRTGHPVTPTANTDTHGVVGQEAGYPRTYVRVPEDDPARLDPTALVEGIAQQRDVVLTNGPFVSMRLGAAEQGARVSLGDKGAAVSELLVTVERAPWIEVSELVLYVGGEMLPPVALSGRAGSSGSLVDEVTFTLERAGVAKVGGGKAGGLAGRARKVAITGDTFIVAVARGARPLEPVLTGDAADILPFGMTAPIWIDADGDGKCLGR
jgi:hypothetical protein